MSAVLKDETIIRFPTPYTPQNILFEWNEIHPVAQCLVAPCGTKVGKSFGAAMWLGKEALINARLFCVWFAPTLAKARIGYRYLKAMLDIPGVTECLDGKMEIRFGNGSVIHFMHGRDAEVTIEGEAIDRFVIDETGKITRQVWYSLLTTITQTVGLGIVTGTPRGSGWYKDVFKMARAGDPFFCWAQIRTEQSPYVSKHAIESNKRLLPPLLYRQYFEAAFVSSGTTFGDLSSMWDDNIILSTERGKTRFWRHPNAEMINGDIFHGVDIAKKRDYTVFYSVNQTGHLVGYCRFNKLSYPVQVRRLKAYLSKYFADCENIIAFDATGIGEAFGDTIAEEEIDATIVPVVFTNRSKAHMITRMIVAIESGFHTAPRIPEIEEEFTAYEMSLTPLGLPKFSAPTGEHDDIVSAALLAVSRAYNSNQSEKAEKMLEQALDDKIPDEDVLAAYADVAGSTVEDDEFFENAIIEYDDDEEQFSELLEA